ncbi:hypothetical protein [Nocardioides sp. CFH 31398]|uniref:hypothetical protein n=1 Tax=Nocardioides sp. CFH 31398 TaxID=2919579 RepID=UPI001F0694B2|nr:hypothetical protein [Nocardioides sp. CFH 31398]MCH1867522.1 hypothetical protein [Nocardioides sp. CFH 31398]
MGTVNMPTPVAVAIAALVLLAGYLLGVVAGPDGPERTTGTVDSFDASSNLLCLSGDSVAALEESDLDVADEQGDDDVLCGRWERSAGSERPETGDEFRFVVVRTTQAPEDEATDDPEESSGRVLIYGAVVD